VAKHAGGLAPMESDLVYYRRRSREEAEAARQALDSRVRDVHLELARRYSERAAELQPGQGDVQLRLVPAA
jgi:hypothetical protein